MKKFILFSLVIMLGLTSCEIYRFNYDIVLDNVERIDKGFNDKCPKVFYDKHYEDKNIKATLTIDSLTKGINVMIANNTQYPIKVNYNNITFSDTNNKNYRMMSKNLSYDEKNSYHQSMIILKDSHIHDEFTPVNNFIGINKISTNIYGYRTTAISKIFTNILPIDLDKSSQCLEKRRKNALDNNRKNYVGSKIKMYIPIEIDGITNEYLFIFKVKNVILQKYDNR